MTLICPADGFRFSEADWLALNVWAARSVQATCWCCGEFMAQFRDGVVVAPGSIGLGFATALAHEAAARLSRPQTVLVRGGR